MAHRRVICDSEDEENEDFGDLDRRSLTADGGEERSPEDPNSDSRSTDPEFFRRIYEGQQNATASFIPDTFRTDTQQQPETRNFASSLLSSSGVKQKTSSSLTDPTMLRSSLKKKTKENEPKELKDMTQVTTPDAPVAKPQDIYDFDFSDDEGAGAGAGPSVLTSKFKAAKTEASSKTDGKRKRSTLKTSHQATDVASTSPSQQLATRDDGSSANHPIELDGDDASPRATRKKRKSGSHQQTAREIPDEVDLLVIPTTADISESLPELDEGDDNLGSIIKDTFDAPQSKSDPASTSSLVIVPPSLTASQKQQYLRFSWSSELDQDKFGTDHHQQQASLPPLKSQTQGFRSTNTESTILYTTPSRYCSSAAPLGGVEEESEHNVSELPSDQVRQPDCSPDELSTHPVEIMSCPKKRKSPPEIEGELAQDDPWDADEFGLSREQYVPRPSKRRSRAVLEEEDDAAAPEPSMPDTCPPGDTIVEEPRHGQESTTNEARAAPDVGVEGLDPEFLAALPDDIRQEIIANHKSRGNTQTARTRSRARPEEASTGLPPAEKEPQPKKRGRKKKLPATDDSIAIEAEGVEAEPSPAPLASTKRKRGRPKKTDPAPAAAVIEDDQPAQDESGLNPEIAGEPGTKDPPAIEDAQIAPPATKVARKRGRKKKIANEAPEPVQEDFNEAMRETEAVFETHQDTTGGLEQNQQGQVEEFDEGTATGGRETLRDISNNAIEKKFQPDAEIDQNTTPVSKSKDNSKSVLTPTSQADKVRYRVGLSKRSRIAPLLKIIRK